VAAIALVASFDYQLLMHLQSWIYMANLGLLLLVLAIGKEVNGAKSWIPIGQFRLQPAELAKVAVIVTLAAFLCRRQERIRELPTLLWSLVYLAPPLLLILKQPDFGTMLSVLSIWFGMLFFGGARIWHLIAIATVGIILFVTAWQMNVLKPHQKERLAVFLDTNPSASALREGGYQIKQSQIAIGAGQISDTDFIFTVVAEELGFIGGAGLLMLYLGLLFRSATLAMTTDNYFGVLIAGGFTSLIAFHTIVNLGMTMRVMPITGVPLPFFSYGGSSYLAFSLCVGLLQSVALRSKRTTAG
jgi:rod shape determining protein RodA